MCPQYEWACQDHWWTVVSTVASRDEPSICPECKSSGTRQITSANLDRTSAGAWNSQGWNPALGCYTRNDQDAKRIAKARGFEEIGNEPVENVHKHYEKQRAETKERRWVEAARDKLFD